MPCSPRQARLNIVKEFYKFITFISQGYMPIMKLLGCHTCFMMFKCLILLVIISFVFADDFYAILNVSEQATDKDIRKAFKQKALEFHPDKNLNDKNAKERFIQLNTAYEVLKDEELRKKYDLYGEEGIENSGSHENYHSWNYYKDNLGIYDDDIGVITLQTVNFEQNVKKHNHDTTWFITYYHHTCSDCHTLAPVWRKLARDLKGIVRIGAVNCDDEPLLCHSEMIHFYPLLVVYTQYGEVIPYKGEKSKEKLLKFILDYLPPPNIYSLTSSSWKSAIEECHVVNYETIPPWLVIAAPQNKNAEYFNTLKLKIGTLLSGLVCIGEIDCVKEKKLCSILKIKQARFYSKENDVLKGKGLNLDSLDPHELAKQVITQLPNIPTISESEYYKFMNNLETLSMPSLFIYISNENEINMEMQKLPGLLGQFPLYFVRCDLMKKACDDLFILKTPTFVLFKLLGGYEIHRGRHLAKDIDVFFWVSATATYFTTLTPNDFPDILDQGDTWFVEFYDLSCPSCMNLMSEFRKASIQVHIGGANVGHVRFGVIDCSIHGSLCTQFKVGQYPTTILFKESKTYEFNGPQMEYSIVGFIRDIINSKVITLDADSYQEKILNKNVEESWVINFYINWCFDCQVIEPEFREFSSNLKDEDMIIAARIDCGIHKDTCKAAGISEYPTIKLFPRGTTDSANSIIFNGWSHKASSIYQWTMALMPSIVLQLDETTFEGVLRSSTPTAVFFFSPSCNPCQHFVPIFELIAEHFISQNVRIKCAKVNCQTNSWLCHAAGIQTYPSISFYEGTSDMVSRQLPYGNHISLPLIDTNVVDIIKEIVGILNTKKGKTIEISYKHTEL